MKLKVITKHLYKALPAENNIKNILSLPSENFQKCFSILNNKKIKQIDIFDLTSTKLVNYNTIIKVKDHINKSGANFLLGNQIFLNIDFIDVTKIYNYDDESVITTSCGKQLNKNYDFPNHYLSNLTILAHALQIPTINAFLYNLP
ncbi:MAG: hypothetical protein CMA12_08240 [Euryarchaeota archaeon]|nr:hypothetical protein [Euryarchaeota archaeon]